MTSALIRNCVATVIVILTLFVGSVSFAVPGEPAWKFNRSFNTWTQDLNKIETRFDEPNYLTEHAPEFRTTLLTIRGAATAAREDANDVALTTQDLLNALGARPAEGEPDEGAEVAEKRQALEAKIADFRGRAAQAQLIVRRVDALTAGLTSIEQGQAVRTLLTRRPSPLSFNTIVAMPGATWQYAQSLAQAPVQWWQNTKSTEREELQVPTVSLAIIFLLIIGFGTHRMLVRWTGRDETLTDPSYTRRLLGASTEGLANGLLPAIFALTIWGTANYLLNVGAGPFQTLITGLVATSLIIIAAIALPRAALSPTLPNWRVAPIKPKYARRITSRIAALGILFGIDVFVGFTASAAEPAFLTSYSAFFATLEAIFIIDLLRPKLWMSDPNWQSGTQSNETSKPKTEVVQSRHRIAWRVLRLIIGFLAIAAAVAAWLGYTALSVYLISGLITSALFVGALFLAKALFAEWIGILMRRTEVIEWLNLSETGSATVMFWLVGLLEVAIYVVGAALIGAAWGLPLNDIWTLVYNLLTGINVGGATISIADIFEAILVFAVTLILFRLAKQLLAGTILPQTRLDAGVQYSISTIFGYIGIVVAIVFAATALGVEFQNLIIIAGALSVGIGFGLQNIANNFISGLILLFERPIKVGDLIEIGDTLGHVTHINVRRTEVETFQRAEVMIPNSELVSTSVINWTHSDRKARIEIPVGVAYGTDTELVRQTLLDAAKNINRIVSWPVPDVLFLDFGDSSLNFQLRCFTNDVSSRITTASALRFEIDKCFREAGIEIPFPQRVVHMAPTPPTDTSS